MTCLTLLPTEPQSSPRDPTSEILVTTDTRVVTSCLPGQPPLLWAAQGCPPGCPHQPPVLSGSAVAAPFLILVFAF